MNKLNLISAILLTFFITALSPELFAQQALQSGTSVKSIDLGKKGYYDLIFSKDEKKQLKKAATYMEDGQKYMLEYNSYQKEIEKLYTIAKATSNPKTSEKSLSKARKLEKKSLKAGKKSLDYYKKGTDIKSNIYTSAINKARLNDNSKHAKAGKDFESMAKGNYEKANEKIKTVPSHDPQLQFNALNDANNLTLNALACQENAFALYNKDPQVDPDDSFIIPDKDENEEYENTDDNKDIVKHDTDKVVVLDSVLFPVYSEQYDPMTDKNLYKTQINKILPLLKLTNDEKKTLAEASRKNQYANDLLKQVDDAYILVDSLNYIADRTPDFSARDKLRNSAIEKEQQAFYKLTNATNIYLDVNELRYQIYKAHFPKVDPKKMTPELEEIKKYEIAADEYHLKAQSEISRANKLMYQSEQYIQKMGANEMMLYALQLQENAYGIYFNIKDINLIKPDTLSGKNKVVNTTKPIKQENTPKNLSWEVTKTFTYSKDKPKVAAYKTKNGTVFLVQLGIFKGIVPADKFGKVQPIVFDEFSNNPNRRFMVGEYQSAEAAELALDKVKKLGYDDAYIVSLINGQRKSYTAGKETVNPKEGQYKQLKKTELAKLSGEKADNKEIEQPSNEGTYIGSDIKNTKGLVYLVQLGMYKKPISQDKLKNLGTIYTDKIASKGTRYMVGKYKTIAKAREENQIAIDNGFKDAYVIAYLDGEHIALDKAKNIESKQNGSIEEEVTENNSVDIAYMVQVGAYREKLSPSEESKLKAAHHPRNIDAKIFEGMNIYFIGNFKTYKEADSLKKKMVNEGHDGVFVIAFNGDEKISVEKALKLNNNK